jgi:transcriptional regulator
MNLEKILAISGKPGLYVLKVQTRTGFVAESLADGKKITVNLKSNVSLLSEISVYTYEGEKPLAEIMDKIADKESNGPSISHKEDNATLAAYFKEVLPDYDEERVYPSDIKKIVNWYNMLKNQKKKKKLKNKTF